MRAATTMQLVVLAAAMGVLGVLGARTLLQVRRKRERGGGGSSSRAVMPRGRASKDAHTIDSETPFKAR